MYPPWIKAIGVDAESSGESSPEHLVFHDDDLVVESKSLLENEQPAFGLRNRSQRNANIAVTTGATAAPMTERGAMVNIPVNARESGIISRGVSPKKLDEAEKLRTPPQLGTDRSVRHADSQIDWTSSIERHRRIQRARNEAVAGAIGTANADEIGGDPSININNNRGSISASFSATSIDPISGRFRPHPRQQSRAPLETISPRRENIDFAAADDIWSGRKWRNDSEALRKTDVENMFERFGNKIENMVEKMKSLKTKQQEEPIDIAVDRALKNFKSELMDEIVQKNRVELQQQQQQSKAHKLEVINEERKSVSSSNDKVEKFTGQQILDAEERPMDNAGVIPTGSAKRTSSPNDRQAAQRAERLEDEVHKLKAQVQKLSSALAEERASNMKDAVPEVPREVRRIDEPYLSDKLEESDFPKFKRTFFKLQLDQIDRENPNRISNVLKNILLEFNLPYDSKLKERIFEIKQKLAERSALRSFVTDVHRQLYGSEMTRLDKACLLQMMQNLERRDLKV